MQARVHISLTHGIVVVISIPAYWRRHRSTPLVHEIVVVFVVFEPGHRLSCELLVMRTLIRVRGLTYCYHRIPGSEWVAGDMRGRRGQRSWVGRVRP